MNVFGSTRSTVQRNHALIAPDSFVRSALPGWTASEGVILIAPPMGARFTQYLALMERGGASRPAPPGVERFVYVLEGELTLIEDGGETVLRAGDCAAFPKGSGNGHHMINRSGAMAVLPRRWFRHLLPSIGRFRHFSCR